ncbi:Mur ligase family protein [Pseudonocardia acidicola]|nr:Mur ligase family protein [Pseudonocardia acidicola]
MIGGRVALAADPDALARLAAGRSIALVSGTNGKSTTTTLLATALGGAVDAVATNIGGANMPDGLVSALLERPTAPRAVLEVDEPYLPRVLMACRPAVVVLLNLTRDQLDRVGETRQLAERIRQALDDRPDAVVVANVEDPLVVWAAQRARRQVWVAAGTGWTGDSTQCPACGGVLVRDTGTWSCSCGLRRPTPDWELHGEQVRVPDGRRARLVLGLPGRMNASNAVHALAAADAMGMPWPDALPLLSDVRQVHGRYRTVAVGGHRVRMLLAKNPAGWQEMLDLLAGSRGGLVLALNAREADGRDPSWIWDVPVEALATRTLVAAGERAADVSVRLTYAGLPHVVAPDPVAGVQALPDGPVDLVADYTAFRGAAHQLRRAPDVR